MQEDTAFPLQAALIESQLREEGSLFLFVVESSLVTNWASSTSFSTTSLRKVGVVIIGVLIGDPDEGVISELPDWVVLHIADYWLRVFQRGRRPIDQLSCIGKQQNVGMKGYCQNWGRNGLRLFH